MTQLPSLTADYKIGELALEPQIELSAELYLALQVVIDDVASQEWKESIAFEIEDVSQACWEHLFKHWDKLHDADWELLTWHVRKAARLYCKKQRIEYMYFTAAYIYTPVMVRGFLQEAVFCEGPDSVDVDARADLTEAITYLTKGQRAVIFKRYAMKELLTTDAEIKAEYRAVKALTDRLNTGLRLEGVQHD